MHFNVKDVLKYMYTVSFPDIYRDSISLMLWVKQVISLMEKYYNTIRIAKLRLVEAEYLVLPLAEDSV